MSGRTSFIAVLPDAMMLGGVVDRGAQKFLVVSGRSRRTSGSPSAAVFVRVMAEQGNYFPCEVTGAKADLSRAAWPQPLESYDDGRFEILLDAASVRGTFAGVVLILVYPEPDLGGREWSNVKFRILFNLPGDEAVKPPTYGDLPAEARQVISAVVPQPMDKLQSGLIRSRN